MKSQTTPTPAIEKIIFTWLNDNHLAVHVDIVEPLIAELTTLIEASRKEVLEAIQEWANNDSVDSMTYFETHDAPDLNTRLGVATQLKEFIEFKLQALGTETGSDINVTSKPECGCIPRAERYCTCNRHAYHSSCIKPAEEQEKEL